MEPESESLPSKPMLGLPEPFQIYKLRLQTSEQTISSIMILLKEMQSNQKHLIVNLYFLLFEYKLLQVQVQICGTINLYWKCCLIPSLLVFSYFNFLNIAPQAPIMEYDVPYKIVYICMRSL